MEITSDRNAMEPKKTRGRPVSFNREDLLNQVMHLFWERGYRAVSFNEIAQQTGLTRASLYNAFKTKENLLKECLSYYMETLSPDANLDALAQKERVGKAILDVLNDAVALYTSESPSLGCFAVNSLNELMSARDELGQAMTEMYNGRQESLRQLLARAVAQGELDSSVNVDASANTLLAYMGGLSVFAKSGASLDTLKDMNRHFISQMGFSV